VLVANNKQFAAIPSPLAESDGYHIHPDKIAEEIARGTSVILTSNPRNPTGKVVKNPELAEIQDICRDRATLVMDEFYGGYNYTSDCDGTTISAAENIEDVDEDDVLIIDGLTKRFRLPGWRIAWIVGPKVCFAFWMILGDRANGDIGIHQGDWILWVIFGWWC
jgi:aspartate/methionine/tyrosine aminotransferase